jgi:tRNA(fMet)-specific endonuclease VapC
MYLLDTNILIYWLKGQGRVAQRIAALSPQHIKVPVLAIFELEYGTAKSLRPAAQRQFIDSVVGQLKVLPLDQACAQSAGLLRSTLEARGQLIGPYDLLIAGIALTHGLTLITRNTREFERVPGLALENWYD